MTDRDACRVLLSAVISESPSIGADRVEEFEDLASLTHGVAGDVSATVNDGGRIEFQRAPTVPHNLYDVTFEYGCRFGQKLLELMPVWADMREQDFRSDDQLVVRSIGTAQLKAKGVEIPFNISADGESDLFFERMRRTKPYQVKLNRLNIIPLSCFAELARLVRVDG